MTHDSPPARPGSPAPPGLPAPQDPVARPAPALPVPGSLAVTAVPGPSAAPRPAPPAQGWHSLLLVYAITATVEVARRRAGVRVPAPAAPRGGPAGGADPHVHGPLLEPHLRRRDLPRAVLGRLGRQVQPARGDRQERGRRDIRLLRGRARGRAVAAWREHAPGRVPAREHRRHAGGPPRRDAAPSRRHRQRAVRSREPARVRGGAGPRCVHHRLAASPDDRRVLVRGDPVGERGRAPPRRLARHPPDGRPGGPGRGPRPARRRRRPGRPGRAPRLPGLRRVDPREPGRPPVPAAPGRDHERRAGQPGLRDRARDGHRGPRRRARSRRSPVRSATGSGSGSSSSRRCSEAGSRWP